MAADDWTPVDEQQQAASTFWDTANDFGRAVSNAATFGMANRAKAYIESVKQPKTLSSLISGAPGTYEEHLQDQVKRSEQARERSPYASVAGDVYGSFAVPTLGAGGLAARMGGGALARGAAYGATGAATGAAQGAGGTYSGELPDYIKNAAVGGALGGAFGSVGGAAFGRRPDTTAARTPTTQELYARADADYGLLRGNKAVYESPYLATEADKLSRRLYDEGYHPDSAPEAFRAVERMRLSAAAPGRVDTPGSIESIRQMLNKIPKTPERAADRDAARLVKGTLDEFVTAPPLGAVRQGSERAAGEASAIADAARETWSSARRGHLMDNIITNAENKAKSIFSGRNVENTIRQSVAQLIKEPAPGRFRPISQFNEAEQAALNKIIDPGRAADTLRTAGNMLGGGGGVATPLLSAGLGGSGGFAGQYFKDDPAAGAALGAALPWVGLGLRGVSNRGARANIAAANQLIHQRNPLYEYRLATAGVQPGPGSPQTAKAARDALALALLKQQTRPEQKYESW